MAMARPRGRLRYVWALLLSVVAPGAGQIYTGRWKLGVGIGVWFLAVAAVIRGVTGIAAPAPAWFLFILCLAAVNAGLFLYVIIDAVRRAGHAVLPEQRRWFRSVTLFAALMIAADALTEALLPVCWHLYHIPSGSNIPAVLIGDYIETDQLPSAAMPRRGAIMVFFASSQHNSIWMKRVIGLPGDRVQVSAGKLILNGVEAKRVDAGELSVPQADNQTVLARQYIETLPGGATYHTVKFSDEPRFDPVSGVDANNTPKYVVPAGCVFVLGDNRDDSLDSRFDQIGCVPLGNLIGQAKLVVFSVERAPHWHVRWGRFLKRI